MLAAPCDSNSVQKFPTDLSPLSGDISLIPDFKIHMEMGNFDTDRFDIRSFKKAEKCMSETTGCPHNYLCV